MELIPALQQSVLLYWKQTIKNIKKTTESIVIHNKSGSVDYFDTIFSGDGKKEIGKIKYPNTNEVITRYELSYSKGILTEEKSNCKNKGKHREKS